MGGSRDFRKQEITHLPGDQVPGAGDSDRGFILTSLVALGLMYIE